ncbi:MAG: histidinol dehydrogenase [Nitrospinae bacterium CG22_combo_CG10-13_8_21_14_all_47_10]|nr:MAG: histidinol dehydrogenase [Nitrospinae bacterium CG22_combo_CG10-13_8_21_14_all_47_10]
MKLCKFTDSDYQAVVKALENRSGMDLFTHDETVRKILQDVKERGDPALLEYTHRFDRHNLERLRVTPDEIQQAYGGVTGEELAALKEAAERIRRFHEHQKQESWRYEEEGITLGQLVRPLATAGIYVPGGKASYPSSVLMNAIPAKVAGVDRVVMCSPFPDGQTRPHVLVAADIAGVTEIYKVGGAQAVAAMAFGTATVPQVDKIVGPGNIFVALAKRLVFGIVDIDMIAGPSEILIVADHSANPVYVAADMLSQAEHDESAVPILVTPEEGLAREVMVELERQKITLGRQSIMEASLSTQCRLLVTESLEEAVDLANRLAPEHLELALEDPEYWLEKIKNAGAVFLGHYTPEAVGDYLAGPNHVLPTSGTARFSSPLGVYDFVKRTSLISYSRKALEKCGKTVTLLAEMEDLGAHANSVKMRLEEGKK